MRFVFTKEMVLSRGKIKLTVVLQTSRHWKATELEGIPSPDSFEVEAYVMLTLGAAASRQLLSQLVVCWPENHCEECVVCVVVEREKMATTEGGRKKEFCRF